MVRGRSGTHDRRGFETPICFQFVAITASLGLTVFYSWNVGLPILVAGCLFLFLLEKTSAPPTNNPEKFALWSRQQRARKPVLLCLGDSLTHGTVSASYTPEIPCKLSKTLGLPLPQQRRVFNDPVWVVNAGQNGITTHTILYERLDNALKTCNPDFVLLLIGTNDIRGVYSEVWGRDVMQLNNLPDVPTFEAFERNLKGILEALYSVSPMTQVGVCTLPPMGENLQHKANRVVLEANEIIKQVVSKARGRVSLVPIFSRMEAELEKNGKDAVSTPVDSFEAILCCMGAIRNLLPFFSWNYLSSFYGNTILLDGLHLNERGRDIVVHAVVEWLVKADIAKALGVKSS